MVIEAAGSMLSRLTSLTRGAGCVHQLDLLGTRVALMGYTNPKRVGPFCRFPDPPEEVLEKVELALRTDPRTE